MPGMNGMELAELLRERGTRVPTLLITGKGEPNLSDRIRRDAVLTTLYKPVPEDLLIDWIERACERRGEI